MPQFIYLFLLLIFCVSRCSSRASMFLMTTSKILMRFNVEFLECLQAQNVFMFLFSVKHSYILTAHTPPDVIILWFSHGMKELLQAILCMLEATKLMHMYMSRHSFVSNFLQEISVITILIYYRISAPSLLKRLFLLKSLQRN